MLMLHLLVLVQIIKLRFNKLFLGFIGVSNMVAIELSFRLITTTYELD